MCVLGATWAVLWASWGRPGASGSRKRLQQKPGLASEREARKTKTAFGARGGEIEAAKERDRARKTEQGGQRKRETEQERQCKGDSERETEHGAQRKGDSEQAKTKTIDMFQYFDNLMLFR